MNRQSVWNFQGPANPKRIPATARSGRSRRKRGALTMELVLIFPVLTLLFVLFFQVSVMLLTYHSLQTTVCHAAAMAGSTGSVAEITQVVANGTAAWYYEPANALAPVTDQAGWAAASQFSFRILGKTSLDPAAKWSYVASDADLAAAAEVMVEVKLPNLNSAYQWYWLLPQFVGVEDPSRKAFTCSALGVRITQ